MQEPVFTCDVFLSHSSKDKPVVREIAERLREVGLRLWFDEWELPVASVYDRRDKNRRSQSAVTAAASERRRKTGTFGRGNLPFRNPLNREQRFILLRLDDALPPSFT